MEERSLSRTSGLPIGPTGLDPAEDYAGRAMIRLHFVALPFSEL